MRTLRVCLLLIMTTLIQPESLRYDMKVIVSPNKTLFAEGDSAYFICSFNVSSKQPELLTWKKNDQIIRNETGRSLEKIHRITGMRREDAGTYTCTLGVMEEGAMKYDQASITIDVSCIGMCGQGRVQFIGPKEPISEGQNVTLICRSVHRIKCSLAIHYQNRNLKYKSGALTVKYTLSPFMHRNTGNYSCHIWILDKEDHVIRHDKKILFLEMNAAPSGKPTASPRSVSGNINTRISINCSIPNKGKPEARFHLYKVSNKNEKTLVGENFTGALNLSTITMSGRYVCQALNSAGKSDFSDPINVYVKAPPSIQHLQVANITTEDVMENLTVEFTISSYKDANYSIHQNRRLAMFNMKSDGHHQSLVGGRRVEGSEESRTFIYPLALKDMSCSQLQRINGRYTFTLHNPDGTAEQQFQINLQYRPHWRDGHTPKVIHAHVGNRSVSLTCPVCANPPATIRWSPPQQDNPDIVLDHETLEISEVKGHHFGVYTCIASNEVGKQVFKMSLKNDGTNLELSRSRPLSSNTVMYAAFGGALLLIIALLVSLAACSSWRKRRISHDRNDIHEPAPEFTIVSSDVSDANSNALTNVSNDERAKDKHTSSGYFTDPRIYKKPGMDVALPAPDERKSVKEEGEVPDYENIEKLPQRRRNVVSNPGPPRKQAQARQASRPISDADIEYCDLDLIGESGSKDTYGKPIIRGRDSLVDYAEIIHDVKLPSKDLM